MTPAQFFEKFDLLSELPNAVGRMRELILEWAYMGYLSTGKDQHQFIALGDILSEPSFNGISNGPTDDSGATEILRISAGTSRSDFFVDEDDFKHVQLDKEEVSKATLLAGDLLACRYNGNLRFVGRFSLYRGISGRTQVNPDKLIRFRVSSDLHDGRYICYVINSLPSRKSIESMCATTAGNIGLSAGRIKTVKIPLPPLAEQKRIVAKVDELMALCDRLEAQQKQREAQQAALVQASLTRFTDAPTPTNLEFLFHKSYAVDPAALRQSILTLAVQGKLVFQNLEEESAVFVLKKVLRDRERQAQSLRLKEPSQVDADDKHIPDLPQGWCYASPDQLTSFHKNALTIGPFGSSLLKTDYTELGVPLIFVRDIRSQSFGGPDTRYISPEKAEELSSHTVRPGDLLITKMGDPPGDTAIYPTGRPPAIITADCIKLTPHRDLATSNYLKFALRAPQLTEQFADITLGVAQQKVSLSRFRCIAVPLPPLAEQKRIVAKVEELMGVVDRLEGQLAASREVGAKLMEAVVAEIAAAA